MSQVHTSIVKKGLAFFLVPVLLQVFLLGSLYALFTEVENIAQAERERREVIEETNNMMTLFIDSISSAGLGLSYNDTFSTKPEEYRKRMEHSFAKLSKYARKDKLLAKVIGDLKDIYNKQYEAMVEIEGASYSLGTVMQLKPIIREGKRKLSYVRAMLDDEMKKSKQNEKKEAAFRDRLKVLIIAGIVFDVLLSIILTYWFLANIKRRVSMLVENARAIPGGAELQLTVKGNDEIAYLDGILHQASIDLRRAEEHRQSLMNMVAHDLRSPLLSAKLTLDMMVVQEIHDEQSIRKRIGTLKSSFSRLVSLVEDLLTVDKLESGKLELNLDIVDLRETVEDSLEAIASQATQMNVELINQVGAHSVVADKNRVIQVLVNYLSNAAKFAPQNSKITVSSVVQDNSIFIRVKDEGPGIDIKEQANLFQKFSQLQEGKTHKGFGLGLAICKMIISQHKGEVGVESAIGQGSTFWFSLPIDESDD